MVIQHEDVKSLREKGVIGSEWTAKDLEPYVDDKYPNQTLANHSACPCFRSKGYHCKVNTKSHRFVRLGNGWYCLPADSPESCPIHNAKSKKLENPYVTEIRPFRQTDVMDFGPKNDSINTSKINTLKTNLSKIVSDLRAAVDNKILTDASISQFIKILHNLGYQYDLDTYPSLEKTGDFTTISKNCPQNLAEALLWKLGRWASYKKFVEYYKNDDSTPSNTDVIFYAFAKHLKNNNDPIFDQHTLRSMWAIDSTITDEEKLFCKSFLMKKNGKWKPSGSGNSSLQCYNLYIRFVRRIQHLNVSLLNLDRLLMPLGQALKKNTDNYKEFCDLCGLTF